MFGHSLVDMGFTVDSMRAIETWRGMPTFAEVI